MFDAFELSPDPVGVGAVYNEMALLPKDSLVAALILGKYILDTKLARSTSEPGVAVVELPEMQGRDGVSC